MDKVGVPHRTFADSNGKVNELLEPLLLRSVEPMVRLSAVAG